MAKKNRQDKQPRRTPKQQQVIPEADCSLRAPVVPEAIEPGEDLMVSEPVVTQVEAPPPPPLPFSSSEEAPPAADESDFHPIDEEGNEVISEEVELLTFNLEKEEYAVDIGVIREITKVTEMTRIPRIQSYLKGIITLRGNVIPVFDMRDRLGLAPFMKDVKNRFIICTTENGMVAMLVDRVNDVVRLVRHHLEAPPAGVVAIDAGFIKNIARYENRLLILLDIEKTLRIDR